jgi:hypothetical protein
VSAVSAGRAAAAAAAAAAPAPGLAPSHPLMTQDFQERTSFDMMQQQLMQGAACYPGSPGW